MGNKTLSPEAKARAEEVFQSWLNAVNIFFAGDVGKGVLKEMPAHLRGPMRSTLAAQIKPPDGADEQFTQAIRVLRLEKRLEAKSQLREVLSARNKDEPLEREWIALEAGAIGNVSSVKRVSTWSLKVVKPDEVQAPCELSPSTAGPETLPAPPSEPESPEPDSKSTMPAPPALTIPAAYSPQALMDWKESGRLPSWEELLNTGLNEEIVDEEQVETRRAILPPPSNQEDSPEIQVEEDLGLETSTSEVDLIFEEFSKDP
ncbi:MAG: hypothetical protein WCW31_00985 [Patescibacteria group bacterium]|jgi:hypothetical protein